MTITRVTDDPGITSTHALHCGKKHSWCGRRWLEAFLMRTAGWCGYCWWRDTARHTGQDQTSWSNLVGLRESWGRVEIPLGQASWTPSWGRANHGGLGVTPRRTGCDQTSGGAPLGRVEIRPAYGTRRHHGHPHEIAWSAARRVRQARQRSMDAQATIHASNHHTKRAAMPSAPRPVLSSTTRSVS